MQGRYNLAHFILAGVVVLGLTPLIVVVDARGHRLPSCLIGMGTLKSTLWTPMAGINKD